MSTEYNSYEEEHSEDDIQKTEDLIEFDPLTPLTEEVLMDFNIDPQKVRTIKFTDEKGMAQSFDTVPLTYKNLPPYFVIERECYGIQSAEFKKKTDEKKEGGEHGMAQMANDVTGIITLPATLEKLDSTVPEEGGDGAEKEKVRIQKRKLQVAIKLTEKPNPDDWTPEEAAVIDFCNNGIRKIWAHVLSRHLGVLNNAAPNIITTVQETIATDFQDPEIANKYNTDDSRNKYMNDQIRKTVYAKFTKKVYRKKIKRAPGEKFDMNANQYDLSSNPGLYPLVKNYVDQKTGMEIVSTNFYQTVEGIDQSKWPSVCVDDAMEYGRCRVEAAIYFDEPFLGGSVLSPKFNVGECYLLEKIESRQGYRGRMVVRKRTPQDRSKIVKKTVTMEGTKATQTIPTGPATTIPQMQQIPQAQNLGPQSFNPQGLSMMAPDANGIQYAPVQAAPNGNN